MGVVGVGDSGFVASEGVPSPTTANVSAAPGLAPVAGDVVDDGVDEPFVALLGLTQRSV